MRANLPIDWENVAEEIESVGKSERRELEKRLIVLMSHLLNGSSSRNPVVGAGSSRFVNSGVPLKDSCEAIPAWTRSWTRSSPKTMRTPGCKRPVKRTCRRMVSRQPVLTVSSRSSIRSIALGERLADHHAARGLEKGEALVHDWFRITYPISYHAEPKAGCLAVVPRTRIIGTVKPDSRPPGVASGVCRLTLTGHCSVPGPGQPGLLYTI
ncbi:MAG: DUF29 family protein [Acetobacteraceae bacterium]|nr:DUF29 family protein [Acetobacteraceae bacterium]